MPVATQASLKGLTPEQLEETGCRLCLNNTYHLGLKPGQDVLSSVGGAHKLQGWRHNILTDSGGYELRSELYCALSRTYTVLLTSSQIPNGQLTQTGKCY